MSVTYNGTTIVSDTPAGVYSGEATFIVGDVVEPVYPYDIPGAAGLGEIVDGQKNRVHKLIVEYSTTNRATLDNALQGMRGQYVSLVVGDSWTGVSETYQYCRLAAIEFGPSRAAKVANTAVRFVTCVMTFVQVVV